AVVTLIPPAIYATAYGLSTRNYALLALLCCCAVGATTADLIAWIRRRTAAAPGRTRWVAVAAGVAIACAPVLLAQKASGAGGGLGSGAGPARDRLPRARRTARADTLGAAAGPRVATRRGGRFRGGDDPA